MLSLLNVGDRETVPTQLQVWHRCLQDDAKTAARAEALEPSPQVVANEPQGEKCDLGFQLSPAGQGDASR